MAVVVKWLTHWIVVPTFAGSIPVSRPNYKQKPHANAFFLYNILGGTVIYGVYIVYF